MLAGGIGATTVFKAWEHPHLHERCLVGQHIRVDCQGRDGPRINRISQDHHLQMCEHVREVCGVECKRDVCGWEGGLQTQVLAEVLWTCPPLTLVRCGGGNLGKERATPAQDP